MISALISIPLTYNYLDKEQFGLMTTIVTTMSLLSFSDLGIGFGLQNSLPNLLATENENKIRQYISNTFILLIAFSGVLILFAILIIAGFDLNSIWKNSGNIDDNLIYSSIATFFCCFVIGIPLSLVQKVQIGIQEGYLSQIWSAIGNIAALVGLFFVTSNKLSLPWVLAALYGLPQLILGINFIYQFSHRAPQQRPRINDFNTKISRQLLSIGTVFVISQIASSLLNASTNIIIADSLGASVVSEFSIISRFALLLTTPIILLIPALLPSINDALALKDNIWIKNLFRRIGFLLSIYTIIIILVFIFFGQQLLNLWIGEGIPLFNELFIPMISYMIYLQVNAWISYVMLSTMYIKWLLKIYPIAVIFTIIGKYLAVQYYGTSGIIYAEVLSMFFLFFLPSLYIVKKNNHI